MIAPILLDTHVALWSSSDPGWSRQGEAAIAEADDAGVAIYVSPISSWEVGLLVSKGRVALRVPPKTWFRELSEAGVRVAPLTPDLMIEASFLPGSLHRDPADRILAATARECGYRLMTRDRPLLAYAEAGHLQAIAC